MKITLTFDTTNPDELTEVRNLVAFYDGDPSDEELHQATADAKADKPAPVDDKPDTKAADDAAARKKAKDDAAAKKKADDEAAATKKAEEEAAAAKKAEEEAAAAGPKITREEVRQKLKEYGALEGREAAIGILKKHGAPSITELAEDKFAAVMADCDV